jgi:hypothetical protein
VEGRRRSLGRPVERQQNPTVLKMRGAFSTPVRPPAHGDLRPNWSRGCAIRSRACRHWPRACAWSDAFRVRRCRPA